MEMLTKYKLEEYNLSHRSKFKSFTDFRLKYLKLKPRLLF